MKTLTFAIILFKKFPIRLILNIFWFLCVALLEMAGVFFIAPIVDIFLNPDLANLGFVTRKLISLMESIGFKPAKLNIAIIFLTVFTLKSVILIFARHSIFKTKFTILKEINHTTYSAFLKANWLFFSSTNRGTMLNTFNMEIAKVGNSLATLGILVSDVFRFFIFITVPFLISWKITISAFGLGLLFAAPIYLLGPLHYRIGQKSTLTANKFADVVQESFGAAKVILGYGNQDKNIKKIERAFADHSIVGVQIQTLGAAMPIIYEPFVWVIILFTMYLSFEYFGIAVSEMTIIGYSLLKVVPIIGNIASQKNVLVNLLPGYEQINHLCDFANKHIQKTGCMPFSRINKLIQFKGVYFGYPGGKTVLSGIDAVIEKGKMTAFAGETGVGKSTLIDLLIGFYEPDKGVVAIDGISLFDYDINSFRQRIGFVPQDSILFNETIRENLLWSKEDATENDIIEACKLANAHDFIMNLPDGYSTIVGDRGVRLSGGQRQRIALARAIIRKPELLILDEATSALDSQSELLIQQAIEAIANQTTIVIIAHRLSTISKADQIYVLERGRIVAEGTYNDLVSVDGLFRNMAEIQGLVRI